MANKQSTRPQLTTPAERFAWLETQPLMPVSPPVGFLRGVRSSLRDIWNHRHLLGLLTRRELKARYKDSAFGYLWTLVRPLVNLLIYYLAIGKVLGAERAITDFAIYVFAGLTAWSLFAMIVSGSTSSIIANSGIVKKVHLPRELFPLTATGSAIVDSLSQLGILIAGALVIRGITFQSAVVFFPIAFLVVLVWALAFGLILSAANVYFRDVQYLVEVFILIGFWLTPTVYSYEMLQSMAPGWLLEIYLWNPATMAVMGFQRAFWQAGETAIWPPNMLDRMVIMLVLGFIFLAIAQRIFAVMQRNVAQEL